MKTIHRLLLLLVPGLWLAACVLPGQPQRQSQKAREVTVAVLPITDVVPLYVAQSEGFFKDLDLDVTLVPVASGAERDTLLQAGQVDCALNEVLGSVLSNAGEGEALRVVTTALRPFSQSPHFYLLAAPQNEISLGADLEGATVAISENTIIQYWTDRLLATAGVAPDGVQTTNVPRIPVRLELLMNGQVDAAVLPDPLASLAILQGAHPILDDAHMPDVGESVISCRQSVLTSRADQVTALIAGWDRAVTAINQDPTRFRNVLIENTRVPEPLLDQYGLPPFPQQEVPSPGQVADVVDWAVEHGLLDGEMAYEDIVATLRP